VASLRRKREGVWQGRVYAGLDPVSRKRRYLTHTINARNEELAKLGL
jgi:hypothetical protein